MAVISWEIGVQQMYSSNKSVLPIQSSASTPPAQSLSHCAFVVSPCPIGWLALQSVSLDGSRVYRDDPGWRSLWFVEHDSGVCHIAKALSVIRNRGKEFFLLWAVALIWNCNHTVWCCIWILYWNYETLHRINDIERVCSNEFASIDFYNYV